MKTVHGRADCPLVGSSVGRRTTRDRLGRLGGDRDAGGEVIVWRAAEGVPLVRFPATAIASDRLCLRGRAAAANGFGARTMDATPDLRTRAHPAARLQVEPILVLLPRRGGRSGDRSGVTALWDSIRPRIRKRAGAPGAFRSFRGGRQHARHLPVRRLSLPRVEQNGTWRFGPPVQIVPQTLSGILEISDDRRKVLFAAGAKAFLVDLFDGAAVQEFENGRAGGGTRAHRRRLGVCAGARRRGARSRRGAARDRRRVRGCRPVARSRGSALAQRRAADHCRRRFRGFGRLREQLEFADRRGRAAQELGSRPARSSSACASAREARTSEFSGARDAGGLASSGAARGTRASWDWPGAIPSRRRAAVGTARDRDQPSAKRSTSMKAEDPRFAPPDDWADPRLSADFEPAHFPRCDGGEPPPVGAPRSERAAKAGVPRRVICNQRRLRAARSRS